MNILLFLFSLEAGLTPNLAVSGSNPSLREDSTLHLSFSPDIVLFEHLHITGTARVDMYYEPLGDIPQFNPVSLSSLVDIYFEYSLLTVGYRHLCQHPIIAWSDDNYPLQSLNQAYDQFYIKISTKH